MNNLTISNPTLDSREVAEMMEVNHKDLLKKIDGINKDLNSEKVRPSKYWTESTYKQEGNGKENRNFLITKRGCEFLAHKTTGTKGNLFTDRYMDKFEGMKKYIAEKQLQDSYMIADPIERAKAWIQEQAEKQKLLKESEENKPKVLFAEAVENSDDVILVKEMATIITQNGFDIGQNQLFEYLRMYNYLCSKRGGFYNLPERKYEDLFRVTKRTIQHSKGTEVKNTPKITGKGQLYFIKKFAEYKLQGLTIRDLLNKKKEVM